MSNKADIENLNTFESKITESLQNKVDKSKNKQLSDENFTTILKSKLETLPNNEQLTQNLAEKLDVATYMQKIEELERRIKTLESKE